MALQKNSQQLCESSSLGYDFIDDLNETFELNKCDKHLNPSGGTKTILEPSNKFSFESTNQKKNVHGKLEIESDESLGILPDLLNDEVTFDLCKTESVFSDNVIHDVFDSEIEGNPTSFVFSPPSDKQFNRISLFLKNVSTPLPNFANDRRYSSTPKVLAAGQSVLSTTDIIEHNSSSHSLDDKEDPIIAGSCRIKFESDFNLDDLKNVKLLTSTHKALYLPQASLVLNEKTDVVKPAVNFEERPKSFENNLNVTQTFSNNSKDLFPCEHEDSIQNVNTLNNTFQIRPPVFIESTDTVVPFKHFVPSTLKTSEIRSNSWSENKNVEILDSTFPIPASCDVGQEKTFVIDLNSTVSMEISQESFLKYRILNETQVLDSGKFSSKQEEEMGNVTFTKELENDTQIGYDNHCYSPPGMAFTPLTQILEETFSENELREMPVLTKNVYQCLSASSENFNPNVTYSEKVMDILLEESATQKDNFQHEFVSSNSPKAVPGIFYKDAEEKISTDHIYLSENKIDLKTKIELSDSLQSISDTFAGNIYNRTHQEKSNTVENDSLNEIVPSKILGTTFNEDIEGDISISTKNNLAESETVTANKMSRSDPLQSTCNSIFSQKTNERSYQDANKLLQRHSLPDENPSKFASFKLSKGSKRLTISNGYEEANFLESSIFQDSNGLIAEDTCISKNVSPFNSKQSDNCYIRNDFPDVIEDSVFASEEINICNHSATIDDCCPEIFSNTCVNNTFSEKTNQLQRAESSVSTDNEQLEASRNSLKKMSAGAFSEKTGEEQKELNSVPAEKNKFQLSLNLPKEITNPPFCKSPVNSVQVQNKIYLNKYNEDSVEITSSNLTNLSLKDTIAKNIANTHNSSLKSCSDEPKTVLKRGLIKPTNIVYPRVVSEQRIIHLPMTKPLCKPDIHKKPFASDFNRTLILSDNSKDKCVSKDLNRKLSLPCLSASSDGKSKSKNNFKKPFEIPSKLGIIKPASHYQKSKLDSKYSNGLIKNIASKNKQNLMPGKNPKIVASISSVNGKERPVSSRLSLHEKLPMKSFKMKECGLKANTAVTDTSEKGVNKITYCPKVLDLPLKEKMHGIKINNANLENSQRSIATSLPRKFKTSISNIPNKASTSKPTVIKQKSAPAVGSYKFDSVKVPVSEKLSQSFTKPKFSSLPKAQLPKINSNGNESKSAGNKVQLSGNPKSKGFIIKPYISEGKSIQFMKTQIGTGYRKQKDDVRENNLDTSIGHTACKQAVQSTNTLSVKKSIGKGNFLPVPKFVKDTKSVNSYDCTTQESGLQNQVCRRTSGKLPQLRRIPAPRCNK